MKKILIIDDNEYKRDRIKEYLSEIYPDVPIEEVVNRNRAVRWIEDHLDEIATEPKEFLVVLDMQFPNMDDTQPIYNNGVSMLRRFKLKDYTFPVVACSSDMDMYNACQEVGYPGYLGYIKFSSYVYQASEFEYMLKDSHS